MVRAFVILLFLAASWSARAQEYNSVFHVGWNTLVPFSDKDFTGKTSSAGARLGYTKFLNERFGLGFEVGYSTLDDYVPLQTYLYEDGAISTDVYNYLYHLTVMANGQYFFSQGKRFIPYASLGLGVALSQYKIFYNVYTEADNETGFAIRPEIGTLFKVKEYSSFGLKAALGFDYATNASDYFATKNFAGLNVQLGIVVLNH